MKLGVIGCGNMATAILSGIINSNEKTFENIEINIFDIDEKKVDSLVSKSDKIFKIDNLEELFNKSHYILLAVKPQNFSELFEKIKEYITEHIFISIAAGVSISKIIELSGTNNLPVVRIMPNTPAFVFNGMSGISYNELIDDKTKKFVESIFSSLGKILVVDESKINAITAVSGSGPAYLFYFAESLIESSKNLGFNEEESKLLVYQTLKGSVELMCGSNDSAAVLRNKVTSPGGTTAAAITVF
jgi:pyrroline-5-carboxylate reductase